MFLNLPRYVIRSTACFRLRAHMLYADDLGLTTNDPGEMQTMLNKLRKYAEKKGLTVNTAKSEVVHFNSKSVSPLQNPFTYDGVVLPEKDRFNIWACCLIEG